MGSIYIDLWKDVQGAQNERLSISEALEMVFMTGSIRKTVVSLKTVRWSVSFLRDIDKERRTST